MSVAPDCELVLSTQDGSTNVAPQSHHSMFRRLIPVDVLTSERRWRSGNCAKTSPWSVCGLRPEGVAEARTCGDGSLRIVVSEFTRCHGSYVLLASCVILRVYWTQAGNGMNSAVSDTDVAFSEDVDNDETSSAGALGPSNFERGSAVGEPAAEPQALRADMDIDMFYVETAQNPDTEFAPKAFLLMQKIVSSESAFAQGLLVLPKHTPLYRYADEIRTAAQMGVVVRNSPRDALEDGARELYVSYAAARNSLDKRVGAFSASMQTRRQELLRNASAF